MNESPPSLWLVFSGNEFYAAGGARDYVSTFDNQLAAEEHARDLYDGEVYDWVQIAELAIVPPNTLPSLINVQQLGHNYY